ncbi:MAG: SPFH domain-containing protein [Pseudomonadota bacterium]
MLDFALFPLIAVVTIAIISGCIVITKQQHVRFIETFGKYSRTASAGLSFKLPWPIQIASGNYSLQILQIERDVSVKSSDNAFVVVPIRVQYQVAEQAANKAFYLLEDAETQVAAYVINQVRSTAAGLDFNALFQSKAAFEDDVEETLTDKLSNYGFRIVNVLVDDPQPSDELKLAFDRVIAAKRLKEAATNEGEAVKIKAVLEAEAQKEAMIKKAEGYAQFREIVAEGNAQALQKFVGETGLSAKTAIAFFAQTNAMEALRDAASDGGKTVLVTDDSMPKSLGGLYMDTEDAGIG